MWVFLSYQFHMLLWLFYRLFTINRKMSSIKFGSHLKELRLHLCQQGASSQGVRFVIEFYWKWFLIFLLNYSDFINKYYASIKNINPKLPILVREAEGIEPRLWARYGWSNQLWYSFFLLFFFLFLSERGRESNVPLSDLNADQILKQMEKLTK